MRLTRLIEAVPVVLGRIGGDVEIHGIVADSRKARPGVLFVAIPGVNVDGHRFIGEALITGAVAVVGERSPEELSSDCCGHQVPWGTFAYVRVPDARQAWGWLCAAWGVYP